MKTHLPTLVAARWNLTTLRDSLLAQIDRDQACSEVRLFFYAVTQSGWEQVSRQLKRWRARRKTRTILAYIGTDHGITEPDAIRAMHEDGVVVRLLQNYTGVFHPKVVWMIGPRTNFIWVGSNNLTRDGMRQNIEFAALLRSQRVPNQVQKWAIEVHRSSVPLSPELLADYETERRVYGEAKAALGAFTWSKREGRRARSEPRQRGPRRSRRPFLRASGRRLIIEVMPRETGQDGKQIQLPMAAASRFFGLRDEVGSSKQITLTPAWAVLPRTLTMTIFHNHTVRLVINELDYNDRPCLLVFAKRGRNTFVFDIVERSVDPARYRRLLSKCADPTRAGSRRWGIV